MIMTCEFDSNAHIIWVMLWPGDCLCISLVTTAATRARESSPRHPADAAAALIAIAVSITVSPPTTQPTSHVSPR